MRTVLSLANLAFLITPAAAQLPESFVVTVDKGGGTMVELNLTKFSMRSPDFRVVSWDSTNGYVEEHTPASPSLPARTYRGYVTQNPNELVLAVVHSNSTLQAETHDGSGRLWSISGVDVTTELAGGSATPHPTAPLAAGGGTPGAPGTPGAYVPPVGLYTGHGVDDIPSKIHDNQGGGTVEGSLVWVEHQWNVKNFFNTRDAKLDLQLSEVIVRKEQFYFPASGNAGAFNSLLRNEWVAQGQNARGYIHSWFPYGFSYAGGYNSGKNMYEPGSEAIAVNALYHEVAHAWRASHYLYGKETMTGSHPSHGEMNTQRVLYTRQLEVDQANGGSDPVGNRILSTTSYPTNLHPRAFADLATTSLNTAVNISPLANDYDANGDVLSIKSFAATTAQGGTVTESAGVLTYTPATGYLGKDVIVYEVQDAPGLYTKGLIHIEVINSGLAAHWDMEDTSGTNASDNSGNGHTGSVVGTDFSSSSVPGPVGNALALGSGDYIIGDDSNLITGGDTTYPLDAPSSNFFDPMDQSYTAVTWFKLDPGVTSATLLSKRNQSALGFRLHADTAGGISAQVKPWGGLQGTTTVTSGPIGSDTWYHVAMVLNRSSNTLRLYLNGTEVDNDSIPAGFFIFNGREDLKIGGDGAIGVDETQIHTKALSLSEIQALHAAGDVPAGIIAPRNGSLNQPTNTQLSWVAGQPTYLHNVYFGTDEAAVAAATTASPEFQGQQAGATFNPGALNFSQNYFWRIDEVDGGTIIPGSVWRFTTAATALTEHLVLHLTMDNVDVQTADGSTHTYDDFAFPAQDFQTFDSVTPGSPGIIGQSIDLTGSADTLRSYDINPVVRPSSGGVSISFWLNTTSTQNGAELVYSIGGAYFMLYYNGDLTPIFDGSSGGATTFNTNINEGQWHHIVAHNNGAGLTTLYVDGSSVGTQSESLHNVGTLNRTMGIGSDYNGLGDNLEASFDDFAVWQRAITPTEITAIHSLGLAGSTFNDIPILVDTSFEAAEGFTGFPTGNHASLGTVVDSLGNIWTENTDARIWNRTDIPTDGVQTLALGINTSAASCDVEIPGTTHGMGIVTFDYASFSSSANNTLRLLYNDNAGSGWVEAWSTEIIGNNPDWTDKPWQPAEVSINVPGDVDLRFETSGSRGAMIDNVKITGLLSGANLPPTANDTSGTVAENAGSGVPVASVVATDPDVGDTLFYAITGGNGSGLFAIDSNGDITTTADLDHEADDQHILIVTVSDNGGLFDTATVTVDVTDLNEIPAFTSDPIVGTNGIVFSPYNGTLAGNVTNMDAGETPVFSILSGPTWLTVATNGTLSGTPGGNDGGLNSFTVQVDDGTGNTAQATLEITVATSGGIFLEGFEGYDVENPSDFSIGGTPTGNWTTNNTGSNATRIFDSGNFGGTRLLISNVNGTSLTSAGITVGQSADYTMSVVLVTETGTGNRTLNASYDILVGQTAATATSIIGGPQSIVTNGDDWVTDNSKTDHLFTENFQTGPINPGDLLFVRFTRVSVLSTGGWFGVDDVQVDLNSVLPDNDGDGIPDVNDPDDDNDGMTDSWETTHGLNPFLDDSAANPDNDDLTNFEEYIADTDPLDRDSHLVFTVEPHAVSGLPTARFNTSAIRNYVIEWHFDMHTGDWTPFGPPFPGTGAEMTVSDPTAATQRFYRLRVSLP